MKIKTAYIIETAIRWFALMLTFPFSFIGSVLLFLDMLFSWPVAETWCLADKIGHNLFLKSKMAHYVKNPQYKKRLTARTAYKLKKQLLMEDPDLSESDL